MARVTKELLSDSTSGRGILISQTATAGNDLHTSIAAADGLDEMWVWFHNAHTADVLVTVEIGGVTSPADIITYTVPFDDGAHLVVPGLLLTGALDIAAFAGTTNVLTAFGYVNRIWTATS